MKTVRLCVTVCAVAILAGCQTVHTPRDRGVPVAAWPKVSTVAAERRGAGELLAAVLVPEPRGRPPATTAPATPAVDKLVYDVLRDAALHPTIDHRGVCVPEAEETRAREVLLTSKRLIGSDVVVVLMVPAGTGRAAADGFEVMTLAPSVPVNAPEPLAKPLPSAAP